MKDLVGWLLVVGVVLAIFIQLYAWASFLAFVILMIMLRDINSNFCELLSLMKSKKDFQ
jgi:hypothetical protein